MLVAKNCIIEIRIFEMNVNEMIMKCGLFLVKKYKTKSAVFQILLFP